MRADELAGDELVARLAPQRVVPVGRVRVAEVLDDGVDASGINVDTDGVGKVVVLKGTVTSAAQRERAEQIAKREAPGYRVENQLMVRAK